MTGAASQSGPTSELAEHLAELQLVDHHVHGALSSDVDRAAFESMITEAPAALQGFTQFDSQVGFAIRRWCAPILGLPTHASADDYWARRADLGSAEVNRRLLTASGTAAYLIDTGYQAQQVLDSHAHAQAAGATSYEIVRLESLAEELLRSCGSGANFVSEYPGLLAERTVTAVGVKSVAAYRHGFDLDPDRPDDIDVQTAVDRWCEGPDRSSRLTDPELLRYLLWCAVDRGLPLQLHCGYGDPDLDLHRANPLLLTPWLRQIAGSGTPVLLLHNYPYHREAGYLAQVFDDVYFDVGLGINYTGTQSAQLIAESLELAPFHKQLYSSDAWGPSELHFLGAALWRRGMNAAIGAWVAADEWSLADAKRVGELIGRENAERVYGLL